MRIILASASPRRKELLGQAGYDFEVEVSEVDESVVSGNPREMVEQLSEIKAGAVALRYRTGETKNREGEDVLVIGADTVVVLDNCILGKPENEKDALRMLKELSGKAHQVYTGVTLIYCNDGRELKRRSFFECTEVVMRSISDREIRDYIATGEPMDKAGAYGIQGKAAVFISGIRGDYYNVVGLPICRLTEEITKLVNECSY
ncbi:MAG: septum formation inhibitor Maf [Eubacterium sp.]|nr:septum formation inhibitor Maf [Eubacterium sp.]